MSKTAIYIKNCLECKECQKKITYTGDSFEVAFDYYCYEKTPKELPRIVAEYVGWNEKLPPVPKWCPKRKR